MGTRHLICIVVDGRFATAQYGQWDGYPGGQGADIVKWLRGTTPEEMEVFKTHARAAKVLDPKEYDRRWTACGHDGGRFVSMDISGRFKGQWPHLSRDHGSNVLNYFLETAEPEALDQDPSFAADSLFCEWAYVLDLDNLALEVYAGFQKEAHTEGRFHDLPYLPPEHRKDAEQEYFPVRLVGKWKFDDIPEDWQKQVSPPDEEDEE